MSGLVGAATTKRCSSCALRATVSCDVPVQRRDMEAGAALVRSPCGTVVCDRCKTTVELDGKRTDMCPRHGIALRKVQAAADEAPAPVRAAVQRHVGNLYDSDEEIKRARNHIATREALGRPTMAAVADMLAPLPVVEIPEIFEEEA